MTFLLTFWPFHGRLPQWYGNTDIAGVIRCARGSAVIVLWELHRHVCMNGLLAGPDAYITD